MDDSKPWYASNAIWANVLQVAVGLATATGVITGATGTAIATEGPGLIIGVVTTALGVWGFYGRLRAKHQLTA